MLDFENLRLSDAEILGVENTEAKLIVRYKDWQDNHNAIIFDDVAGYQWFNPEKRALSHGSIELSDSLLDLACQMADEDGPERFKIFSFVSAWNDAKILRVVAMSATQE